MATLTKDTRTVRITITQAELVTLFGSKAKEAGLIDFDPDRIQIMEIDPGVTLEVIFEIDAPAP